MLWQHRTKWKIQGRVRQLNSTYVNNVPLHLSGISFSDQCTAQHLIRSWVNTSTGRDFSLVSMRLWPSWHSFLSQWLVTDGRSCTAQPLTGEGRHVCRLGETCCKPLGPSNSDRWHRAAPKKTRQSICRWRLAWAALHSCINIMNQLYQSCDMDFLNLIVCLTELKTCVYVHAFCRRVGPVFTL